LYTLSKNTAEIDYTYGACQIAAMTPDSREMSPRGQMHTCMRRLTMVGKAVGYVEYDRSAESSIRIKQEIKHSCLR